MDSFQLITKLFKKCEASGKKRGLEKKTGEISTPPSSFPVKKNVIIKINQFAIDFYFYLEFYKDL
jgi:hypothetical protein